MNVCKRCRLPAWQQLAHVVIAIPATLHPPQLTNYPEARVSVQRRTLFISLHTSKLEQRQQIEMQDGEENRVSERENGEKEKDAAPLMALNHVSRVCRSVKESVEFYTKVLGFVLIERPGSFDFDGAWLFNYGVGIHLVQNKDESKLPKEKERLDPMDNHISFQCENMEAMVQKLEEMNIKYMKRIVGEKEGAPIDQLFFKDPDGFMIEICNCENLKLVPQRSIGRIKLPSDKHNPPIELGNGDDINGGD